MKKLFGVISTTEKVSFQLLGCREVVLLSMQQWKTMLASQQTKKVVLVMAMTMMQQQTRKQNVSIWEGGRENITVDATKMKKGCCFLSL